MMKKKSITVTLLIVLSPNVCKHYLMHWLDTTTGVERAVCNVWIEDREPVRVCKTIQEIVLLSLSVLFVMHVLQKNTLFTD